MVCVRGGLKYTIQFCKQYLKAHEHKHITSLSRGFDDTTQLKTVFAIKVEEASISWFP